MSERTPGDLLHFQIDALQELCSVTLVRDSHVRSWRAGWWSHGEGDSKSVQLEDDANLEADGASVEEAVAALWKKVTEPGLRVDSSERGEVTWHSGAWVDWKEPDDEEDDDEQLPPDSRDDDDDIDGDDF